MGGIGSPAGTDIPGMGGMNRVATPSEGIGGAMCAAIIGGSNGAVPIA